MEILGKAFLQKEAGEQLSPPLGDSYALAQILLQDFHSSHFTHVPPVSLHSPLLSFSQFVFIRTSRAPLLFFFTSSSVADRKFTHL